ncbi:MAG: hypothetical protein JWO04_5422 [Gammaproteobacteria bacterium]|nr:hypothetical protein [Gammaproteobacteria bacterium]
MKHHLLLGAGFSRNWGGWLASEAFEYLLGDIAVAQCAPLRELLWKNQPKGGFEAALDELRRMTQRDRSQQPLLAALESAIIRMFDAMNAGYNSQPFEFRDSIVDRRPVQSFLSQFNAIFTLNQDLLLERHYLANKDNNLDFESWKKWQLPGMQLVRVAQGSSTYPSATGLWQPSGNHVVGSEQPLFKLHGSSNWRTADAKEMLILGGGKKEAITRYPLLKWYFEEFSTRLYESDTRLMVIGYSFRDDHINEVLQAAIAKGLRVFVVDSNGSDVAKVLNSTAQAGRIYAKTSLEEDMQTALIGASRRLLREIFGNDEIERAKVMRFFAR